MLVLFLITVFCIGLIIGSFTNCFIWRLYKNESLWGRSYCPKCKKKIAWYDNIPVLSYLILKAKCRKCKKAISIQYPVVEFACGILFVVSFYLNYQSYVGESLTYLNFFMITSPFFIMQTIRDFFIIFVMISIFIYDLRWFLIPDKLILPSCLLVFLINIYLGADIWQLLLMGIIGASFFLFQFIISRGAWIGGGDIRLGLFMGLAIGEIKSLTLAIILAYFIGSVVGIYLILAKKKNRKTEMPLGVFLSISTIITLFFSKEIINWYMNIF